MCYFNLIIVYALDNEIIMP